MFTPRDNSESIADRLIVKVLDWRWSHICVWSLLSNISDRLAMWSLLLQHCFELQILLLNMPGWKYLGKSLEVWNHLCEWLYKVQFCGVSVLGANNQTFACILESHVLITRVECRKHVLFRVISLVYFVCCIHACCSITAQWPIH